MSTNTTPPGPSTRVVEVARRIVDDLVAWGPASKAGFCGRFQGLGYNAYPHFDAALHYARMNLLGPIGKPIIYSANLDEYGFPEDIIDAEVYILRVNASYMATRAATMAEQARLAQQQHGASAELAMWENVNAAYSFTVRTMSESFKTSTRTQRAAQATGAQAKVYLEIPHQQDA